jgi:hypothetical protein
MPIEISREDLYERVWTEPIQKLSKEYGLSDVGLAKTCRRHNIPIPPRGYWAKKQAGHPVTKDSLPQVIAGAPHAVRLPGASPHLVKATAEPLPIHPLVAAESEAGNAITVAEDLRIRHPLLQSTREYWRVVARRDFRWDAPRPKHIEVNVAKQTRPRALRLLQALFTALEKRGYQMSAGEQGRLHITVLEEQCELHIRERQRQVRCDVPKSAKASPFESTRPYDLVHTGELELRIEMRFRREIVRDGKDRPVETRLNDVVAGLIRAALAEKEYRAEQERARLAQVERERQQAIAKQRARDAGARVKRLEQLMDAVDHHKRLVRFSAELREAIGSVESSSELARWLEWIDSHVDEADMLRRFRERQPTLTLYHCISTWESDRIVANGFNDRESWHGEDEDLPGSVLLSNVPMEGAHGGTVCIVIDVPEETALPYESFRRGKTYRTFRIPADIANRFERRLDSSEDELRA